MNSINGDCQGCVALHLLNHDFVHDQRVERAANVTLELGYRSTILCYNRSGMVPVETRNGIEVVRVDYGQGALARFFPKNLARTWNFLSVTVRFILRGLRIRPDIVHANDLPTLMAGWVIARLSKARFIYDSHELWSDELKYEGLPRAFALLSESYERFFARRADAVITVSPGIASIMKERLSLRALPWVVRNVPDAGPTKRPRENFLRSKFALPPSENIVIFQGNIGKFRNLNELVEAMALIRNPDIALVILGNGELVEPLKSRTEALGLSRRVFFHKAVPYKDLPQYTQEADLGACLQEPISLNYVHSMPNKLFEYLSAGVPVLVGATPDIAEIISDYNAGIAVSPVPEKIAEAIDRFFEAPEYSKMMRDGARHAAEALTWDNEKKILIDAYERR